MVSAQSYRNDGSPRCLVDAPAPNMIYGRSPLRYRSETNSPYRVAWQTRYMIQPEGSLQSEARRARLHFDARHTYHSRDTHSASVAAEPIGCPLCRGRKVEFVIRGTGRSTDECL